MVAVTDTPDSPVIYEELSHHTLHTLEANAHLGDPLCEFVLKTSQANPSSTTPNTHKQAMRTAHAAEWTAAEQSELHSMHINKVMLPTMLPPGIKPLHTRWVYRTKLDKEGQVKQYKARLVVKGYEQVHGIDYDETYSPVARLTSVRLVLALSAKLGMPVHQMDVDTAFLNAGLDEDVYIVPPDGMPVPPGCDCFKLQKALYGLKQAPRQWNDHINDFLTRDLHFTRLNAEPCIYFRKRNGKTCLIALYVDDLIISGSDMETINSVKRGLSERYSMKDLGEVDQLLGCEIKRDSFTGNITMAQRKYIKELLQRFLGDSNIIDVSTPADQSIALTTAMCPTTPEEKAAMAKVPYREAVGCLIWLSMGTRPDISYAVSQVAKFNDNPGEAHWTAVLRIFRYLHRTIDYVIQYQASVVDHSVIQPKGVFSVTLETADAMTPLGFVDSDHARDPDTRRSVTGYVFTLAGGPIVWQSRNQTSVALSSMEAEYMAACAATQEAMWLRMLLVELGCIIHKPLILFEDNQSCIYLAHNPKDHRRSKHIDRQYHYVREQVAAGTISLEKIPTKSNCSDILTKPLGKHDHEEVRDHEEFECSLTKC